MERHHRVGIDQLLEAARARLRRLGPVRRVTPPGPAA